MTVHYPQQLFVAVVVLFGIVNLFPVAVNATDNTLGDFERPYQKDSSRPAGETAEDTDVLEAVAADLVWAMGKGMTASFLPERGRFYQPSPYDRPGEPAWSSRPKYRDHSPYQGYSLTARTDYYYVEDDLDGVGVDLDMRFSSGVSLDGSLTNYTEDIDNGADDDLTHWDMHLSTDLALTSSLMFSPGVGGVGVSGDDHHSGPSYGM